jgi:hypothetical protein
MEVQAVPMGSRRDIRRHVELGCELISNRTDAPTGCLATDLSTTGIWICTAQPVRAGEHVVVCFQPAAGEGAADWHTGELTLFAEVTRVMTTRLGTPGGGMGLEFLDLEGAARRDLTAWLARRKMPVPRRRRPLPRLREPAPAPQRRDDPPIAATRPHSVAFRPAGVWR